MRFLDRLCEDDRQAREARDSLVAAGCKPTVLGLKLLHAAVGYTLTAETNEALRLGMSKSRFDGLAARIRGIADEISSVDRSAAGSSIYLLIEKMKKPGALDPPSAEMAAEADRFMDLPATLRRWADFQEARADGVAYSRGGHAFYIPEARAGPGGRGLYDVDTAQEVLLLDYVRRRTDKPRHREVGDLLAAVYHANVSDGSRQFDSDSLKKREKDFHAAKKTAVPIPYHLLPPLI